MATPHPGPPREVLVSAVVQASSWAIFSLLLRCGLGGWDVVPLRRVRFSMVVQALTLRPRSHACPPSFMEVNLESQDHHRWQFVQRYSQT